jgi:uncharacterized low-complexity protein
MLKPKQMLPARRKRFTYANVASTLALVFAMTGGAYAADKVLITSTKQISPKVLTALKGKNGKNGTNGAQGPAGATGSTGPAGTPGTNGTNGTNGKEGKEGKKGEEGSPWPGGGTLAPEATETGVWGVTGEGGLGLGKSEGEGFQYVPISFPIPLPAALPETNTHYVTIEEITNSTAPAACKGTAEKPTATPGNLCVYENAIHGAGKINTTTPFADPESNSPLNEGVGKTGGLLIFEELAKNTKGLGTWAVTAPPE